jgi:hypothetical protein
VVTRKCTIFCDGSCVVYRDYTASHCVMGTHYSDETKQLLGLQPSFQLKYQNYETNGQTSVIHILITFFVDFNGHPFSSDMDIQIT